MPPRRFCIASVATVAILCLLSINSFAGSPGASPTSKYKVIYSFNGTSDGGEPLSDLTFDADGNLYGTTAGGEAYGNGFYGYGTVFELKHTGDGWKEEVLYNFTGGSDGASPNSGVIFDNAGSLYGFTAGDIDKGTDANVFRLTPGSGGSWTESVVYSFDGFGSVNWPVAQGDLVTDARGDLFGVFQFGRGGSCGVYGCVFELIPRPDGGWKEKTLYNFAGPPDGAAPSSSLVLDPSGNLYGTTMAGGTGTCHFVDPRCGIVYELTHGSDGTWTENILYNFVRGGGNAVTPFGWLALSQDGHIMATSLAGGDGLGTVFELKKSKKGWEQDVLHRFYGGPDGEGPAGRLVNSSGALFGVTLYTVFELTRAKDGWREEVLHSFPSAEGDGFWPQAGLVQDSHGHLYGTTEYGGSGQSGTVYEMTLEGGER